MRFESCYGIRQLTHDFHFKDKKVYSVYAPNGFMKTSFSKTFSDASKGLPTGDVIFPERLSTRLIQDENGIEIKGDDIFVIEPYNQDFSSDKVSLLVVNQAVKKTYDEAVLKIEKKKDSLITKLKQLSGLTGRAVTPEIELRKCFQKDSIFEIFEELEEKVGVPENTRLSLISYAELFNDKTIGFLESGKIQTELKEYIETYNELLASSSLLKKSFNHFHAKTVQKNLVDNGFFSANHTVNLFNGKNKEEIISAELFNEKIEEEKKRILCNAELEKKFDAIDKKLSNVELRRFRDYLFEHKEIVADLSDYKKLQKEIWISYLANQRDLYSELINEYRVSKGIIQAAINAAKSERTAWEDVVEIFNKRFTVPFKISISNQDDVILKGSIPQIVFTFYDHEVSSKVDRNSLLKVLSQGEKRALYILNILFDLTARKRQGLKTILVVDDIADSFDYKNKYAIVEYLKEISEAGEFYSIFLTHNFDFHRTISSRLGIPRQNRLFAVKNGRDLKLVQEIYQKNPFEHWKKNFANHRFVVSAIPFVRNLAEYCGYEDEFLKLTCLLHLKVSTKSITIKDLETIYRSILKDKANLSLVNSDRYVIDLLFELAEEILIEPDATAELESKIILSIAIRLLAEEFMIKKIGDQNFVDGIAENQTAKLLTRFKAKYPLDLGPIALLEQVNLMTPENIHLNSFMYEPILDMAPEHLKKLYKDVKDLNA
ncbi:hypothetical protein [Noviherbaspirillum massiliense]|uniref:hypothetical protein n=1 Tax=Noviherbaspirillum massiliense TaxID=1465823 RepID=UPI00030BAC6E|nr:hypothetical protein [Noviherbaspirillum massiliense]